MSPTFSVHPQIGKMMNSASARPTTHQRRLPWLAMMVQRVHDAYARSPKFSQYQARTGVVRRNASIAFGTTWVLYSTIATAQTVHMMKRATQMLMDGSLG